MVFGRNRQNFKRGGTSCKDETGEGLMDADLL